MRCVQWEVVGSQRFVSNGRWVGYIIRAKWEGGWGTMYLYNGRVDWSQCTCTMGGWMGRNVLCPIGKSNHIFLSNGAKIVLEGG